MKRSYVVIAVVVLFAMYLLIHAPIYNDVKCMPGFQHSHFGYCQLGKFFEIPYAYAVELTANINPQEPESQFIAKYHTTVQIQYDEGGKLQEILKDKNWTIRKNADATDSYTADITSRLNQKLAQNGSDARISDLSVTYQAELRGQSSNASIEYSVVITGTLSDYVITRDIQRTLIDMGWKGISMTGSVLIDGYDINLPLSAIMEKEPEVYSIISSYPKVTDLLSSNILDAQDIQNTPLAYWHFLFDPTGINSDGSVMITEYSLDSNILQKDDSVKSAVYESFVADIHYKAGIIQSADSASIRIVGFAALNTLDGVEILGVTPMPPQGFAVTTTGDIPFVVTYGLPIAMTIAASVIGYFLFKNRTTFF